jgi:hypothetical protein
MGEDGRAVAFHVCSLNLMPGLALGTIDASVALLTSTCERTGRSGRQLNNGPGPEVPSDLLGAQVAHQGLPTDDPIITICSAGGRNVVMSLSHIPDPGPLTIFASINISERQRRFSAIVGELPEFPLHVLGPKVQALISRTAKGVPACAADVSGLRGQIGTNAQMSRARQH